MFITFEGIEGSGKTTQIDQVSSFLKAQGNKVVVTREPGATNIGKKIRSILLDPKNTQMSYLCELLLYEADRAQHLAQVVIPSLKAGKLVLCDRFADATSVYQGSARGIDMELIKSIHKIVVADLIPDLTILFDLDPEIGLKRTFKALAKGLRADNESRFEQEKLNFHKKVRQGYLDLAYNNKERFVIVDASKNQDEVFKNIVTELQKYQEKKS